LSTHAVFSLINPLFTIKLIAKFELLITVSRRILKDHYQGELEEDESPDHLQIMDNDDLMNENSFESDDYAEPVSSVVTPIPPSGNYPQDDHPGYYRTTTRRPASDLQSKRGGGFFGKSLILKNIILWCLNETLNQLYSIFRALKLVLGMASLSLSSLLQFGCGMFRVFLLFLPIFLLFCFSTYYCINVNQLGDTDDVVLDVDDNMLGDLGEDELRRRQQQSDQARPGDSSGRFTSPPRRRGNSSSTKEQPNGQNVFNLITEWISSVSFMKGIHIIKTNQKDRH
jgi:hypothetical protein